MKKIDSTILKETKYIAVWVILCSMLMEAIFLVISRWDYTVLLGNLLGAFTAVLNFFLMGLTVQSALQKEEKEAKTTIRFSQIYRNIMIIIVAVLGFVLPCFNNWAVILPLLFPRVAIAFRPLFDKKGS